MANTYTSGVWAVKPGQDDDFVAAWNEFVKSAAEMPGSGTFRLLRDLDRPGRFMSFADWESFDAQQAWRQHPEFAKQIARAQAHCEDFHSKTYEVVAEVS
jgi:heme-degrading monooxygenase HmoA